jgi:alkanesulfonate monooxygenase SsuD/methylene tetrahydromethanopterin reductase-like flavin-dependent oxidoreductase (luciferase family)
VAKQASSVAFLTGNRVRLGVGLSPWPEDYRAMGVPWERRGKRMDEAIDIVRGLTTGEYFSYHGEIFDIPEIKLCPAPTEPIPILVGGHSDAALRRAVLRGDGWMHAGGTPEELDALLDKLSGMRRAEGHHRSFEVQAATSQAFTVDGVRRLEDRGVTEVRMGFRNPYQKGPDTEPLQRKLDKLRRYADEVIANVQD